MEDPDFISRIEADFVLSSGAALLPNPSKVLTGGEDAHFISGRTWLGVVDGVSQWSLEGVNPGVYAQELIEKCENIVSDCIGDSVNNLLKSLHAVARTQSPGSLTVLIAHLDGQEIVELLASQAQEVGRSASARCPFADAAQATGYVGYAGRKLDDVAVIVSVV